MLVSFIDAIPAWGVNTENGVVSGARLLGGRYGDIRAVLAASALRQVIEAARGLEPDRRLADLRLLPTIPNAAHVFCAGLNYADHAAETGKTAPAEPRIFLRANSSLIGHGAPLMRPRVSSEFDYEGELAVIIGEPGHRIPEEHAMEQVAGYSCFMDGSLRDWQKNTTTMGKNFIGTGAFGPGLVPASDVPDWRALTLMTRVNKREVQRVTLDLMIHAIPRLIAYVSQMTPLQPGDVIVTGTPEGIGSRRTPPLWLTPGDLVEVEVPGVGLLANQVVDGD